MKSITLTRLRDFSLWYPTSCLSVILKVMFVNRYPLSLNGVVWGLGEDTGGPWIARIFVQKNMLFKTAPYESKTKNINSTIDKLHCLNQHFSRTLCILVVVECQSHSYRDSQIFGLSLQFFTHNSFKRYLSWEIDI